MIDFLIQLGIGATFVIFAVCLLLLRREIQKQKKMKDQNVAPPKKPHG